MNIDKEQKPKWKKIVSAFLIGQGISLFGSQIVQMAIIWYVTLETSSGIWVTVLTLVAFLPQTIISLFAGVWADRYNRKKIIIISDSVIAATTLLLALFMMSGIVGKTALPAIIIVSIIRSVGTGIQIPAINAILPHMVPEEELMRVNGYNGSIQSIVQLVSSIAAGAIMSIGPIYNIMFIDVLTAVIGIGILSLLKIPKHQQLKRTEKTSVFTEMKDGFRFTWSNRFIRKLLMTYGAFIFLSVPSGFLAGLMIERTFGNNVILLTINETVGFSGMLISGLLLGVTGGFKNRNTTFFAGLIIYGITSMVLGFVNVFWLFAALMFFIGLTVPAAQTAVFTLVQEKAEPSMMGRIFSLVNVMFTGFMPLGMAIFGPLANVVRIQTIVIVCAIPVILLGLNIILSREFYKGGYATNKASV